MPIVRALDLVFGYMVGLDTRGDLRRAMSDENKPWEIGKSFDRSAALGALQPASRHPHLREAAFWLKVHGAIKQNANLDRMIRSVAEQVSKLSQAFEIVPGEVIYPDIRVRVVQRSEAHRRVRAPKCS